MSHATPNTKVDDRTMPSLDDQIASGPVSMVIRDHGPRVDRPSLEFTPQQEGIIRRMYAPGTTDDEFAVFLYVCKATGLNPLARQIHAMKRNQDGESRLTIQTGIDGFRIVAERTGKYAGQTPPQWCGDDGVWRDVWASDKPPVAARVGVFMRGFTAPLFAVAHYREYVQKKRDGTANRMWKTMPANQLAKCAEALALRKAAPQELSGIYTTDEMAQADNASPAAGTPSYVEPTFPFDPHKGAKIGDPSIKTSQHVAAIEWLVKDEARATRFEATVDAIIDELVGRVSAGIVDPSTGALTAMTQAQLEALGAKLDKSPAAAVFTPVADAVIERLATIDDADDSAAIDDDAPSTGATADAEATERVESIDDKS